MHRKTIITFLFTLTIVLAAVISLPSCKPVNQTGTLSEPELGGITEVRTIVFTGDSITDAGRDKKISDGMFLGTGYVSLVNDTLLKLFSENTPAILNSGVSGNTAMQLCSRFGNDVDAYSPDWVVILIGINDAYNEWTDPDSGCDPENFRKYLRRIFHDYAFAYKKVFLLTPFYIEEHDASVKRTEYLDKYVDVLRDIVSENENAVLVNVQKLFDRKLQEIGSSSFQKLSPDRVHLTEEGSVIVKDALLEAFGIGVSE